jgi:putative transposase
LITYAYSIKIVGYILYPIIEAIDCIEALEMAVNGRRNVTPSILIHHSDQGIPYWSFEYINILMKASIAISMIQSGNSYKNAIAERVNGIIKNEFSQKKVYQNHQEAKKAIARIILTYIERRPHSSTDFLTLKQAHN